MNVEKSLLEYLTQCHMKGQMDAGCKEPSYSNAVVDCKPFSEEFCQHFTTPKRELDKTKISISQVQRECGIDGFKAKKAIDCIFKQFNGLSEGEDEGA